MNCVVCLGGLLADADSVNSELKTFINGDYQEEKDELTTLEIVAGLAQKLQRVFHLIDHVYRLMLTAPVSVTIN